MSALRVAVSGAGIGGLALAQGLRRRGVEVTVYESDGSALSRDQGFRLRIDAQGRAALADCLPARLHRLAEDTAGRPYTSRGLCFDHRLTRLGAHRPAAAPDGTDGRDNRDNLDDRKGRTDPNDPNDRAGLDDPGAASMVADRRVLRQILLTGLGDAVRFGHRVTGYRPAGEGVFLDFADGTAAAADVLVLADGINSRARRHLLPRAQVLDTGLRAVQGHMPLDAEALDWVPPELLGGSRPVLGPHRTTLVVGAYQPRRPVAEAVAEHAPGADIEAVRAYFKWTLVAPAGQFPYAGAGLSAAGPLGLHAAATRMTKGWHPLLRRVLARSDRAATFALSIRAVPVPDAWPPGRVTALGDCVHAPTPVGGLGANTALRDAALLSGRLADARAGRLDVTGAIGLYEEEMRGYARAAVDGSLRGAETVFRADPLPV
ncbi:FAD-dependent monooxygenase [Streptomyces sp. MST-110588]|uniref:FAD-dependent oxidoreductase n=1 Tax=Streptomyces sp. MST-110588 TaxID=2833628 RepID=UPI001F5C1EC2|nr:FAD-dependent monooxygenase [Streptomyces sp. MST-110588]UNO40796.1 FAD-dependent monooxygenase [Streptomyces sp. MST-110588]